MYRHRVIEGSLRPRLVNLTVPADYRVGDEVTFTSPDGSRLAVENTFFRYKSIIVDGLRARSPAGQGSEVVLGCEIFNRMTALGRPVSYRLGR